MRIWVGGKQLKWEKYLPSNNFLLFLFKVNLSFWGEATLEKKFSICVNSLNLYQVGSDSVLIGCGVTTLLTGILNKHKPFQLIVLVHFPWHCHRPKSWASVVASYMMSMIIPVLEFQIEGYGNVEPYYWWLVHGYHSPSLLYNKIQFYLFLSTHLSIYWVLSLSVTTVLANAWILRYCQYHYSAFLDRKSVV